jgi:hypothetical protein
MYARYTLYGIQTKLTSFHRPIVYKDADISASPGLEYLYPT